PSSGSPAALANRASRRAVPAWYPCSTTTFRSHWIGCARFYTGTNSRCRRIRGPSPVTRSTPSGFDGRSPDSRPPDDGRWLLVKKMKAYASFDDYLAGQSPKNQAIIHARALAALLGQALGSRTGQRASSDLC